MGADVAFFRSKSVVFEKAGGEPSRLAGYDFRPRGGGLLEEEMGGRETFARQNDLRRGCKIPEEHKSRAGERGGGQVP